MITAHMYISNHPSVKLWTMLMQNWISVVTRQFTVHLFYIKVSYSIVVKILHYPSLCEFTFTYVFDEMPLLQAGRSKCRCQGHWTCIAMLGELNVSLVLVCPCKKLVKSYMLQSKFVLVHGVIYNLVFSHFCSMVEPTRTVSCREGIESALYELRSIWSTCQDLIFLLKTNLVCHLKNQLWLTITRGKVKSMKQGDNIWKLCNKHIQDIYVHKNKELKVSITMFVPLDCQQICTFRDFGKLLLHTI